MKCNTGNMKDLISNIIHKSKVAQTTNAQNESWRMWKMNADIMENNLIYVKSISKAFTN